MPPAAKSRPPYRRIIDNLSARIARRELLPGDPLPTRAELAQEFGMARATIDKALGEMVRDGIVAGGSGRRTVVAGKGAVTSIAVLWDWTAEQEQSGGDYLDLFFRGVRDACAEFELNVHFRRAPVHAAHDLISPGGSQGVLLVRPDYADRPAIDALRAASVPVVVAPAAMDSSAPCVASDNSAGVELALGHLQELGHRRIGFLDLTATIPDHFERLQAFLAGSAARRTEVHPDWVWLRHENGPSGFDAALGGYLAGKDRPTAILAGDFIMALSLLRRLAALGLRVPQDVSVVAFDDPPAAASVDPPLTTVAQSIARVGFRSVERLVELVSEREGPTFERVPMSLVVRRSTAPPSCGGAPAAVPSG